MEGTSTVHPTCLAPDAECMLLHGTIPVPMNSGFQNPSFWCIQQTSGIQAPKFLFGGIPKCFPTWNGAATWTFSRVASGQSQVESESHRRKVFTQQTTMSQSEPKRAALLRAVDSWKLLVDQRYISLHSTVDESQSHCMWVKTGLYSRDLVYFSRGNGSAPSFEQLYILSGCKTVIEMSPQTHVDHQATRGMEPTAWMQRSTFCCFYSVVSVIPFVRWHRHT